MIIHYNNTHEKECKNLSTFQLKNKCRIIFLKDAFQNKLLFYKTIML